MHKLFWLLMFLVSGAAAQAACLPAYVKDVNLVGQGTMRVMLWHVYDAALYAPKRRYDAHAPFVLRLTYQRDIKGKRIAEVSADEIRKQGMSDSVRLGEWQQRLEEIFPDVAEGDTLTGVFTGKKTVFCQGSKKIGVMDGVDFANRFFGIWLSPDTSAPDLRRKLLGMP